MSGRFFDPGPKCRYCGYGGALGCSYLLITGRRRPCPPGDRCTEFLPMGPMGTVPRGRPLILPETHIRPERRHIGRTRRAPVAEALSQSEEDCRLYAEGASDRVIAQAAGCCPTTVAKWRRRTGRPANRKGRTNHAKTENSQKIPGCVRDGINDRHHEL